MGKLFWIGSGVGLVAAVGLWGAVTRGIGEDVADLHKSVGARRDELHQWATPGLGKTQRFDDIVNQSFINAENAYKGGLTAATAKLHEQMRARNMSIAPTVWTPPPPMHEVSNFRRWLAEEYAARNAKLGAAGVAMPKELVSLGEVADWDNVEKDDLPRILRQYRVSCEVFDALAKASAKVHYYAKVKDDKGTMVPHESKEHQTRKVVEIENLSFEDKGVSGRPGGRRAKPVAAKGKFKEHKFTVRFNAHHGAALDFVRRLEESKVGLFVIRTVEFGRVDRLTVQGPDEEATPYDNKIYHEAPAVVEVAASLIEFFERKGG